MEPDWSGTWHVGQNGLELPEISLLMPPECHQGVVNIDP